VIDINDDGKFAVTLTINGKEKQEKNITEIISFERWMFVLEVAHPAKTPTNHFCIIDSSGEYLHLNVSILFD
jgi:hypothetical protein